jgi:hypothetical protein
MLTENHPKHGAIIFSLSGDTVWASWPGKIGGVEPARPTRSLT